MVKYILIVLIVLGGYLLWPRSHVSNQESTELAKGINSLYRSVDSPASSQRSVSSIHLYATSWCGYCAKTRNLFKQRGVRYIEYDIEKDRAARARYNELKGRGVPLVEADGRIIRGYNEPLLRQLVDDDRYKL